MKIINEADLSDSIIASTLEILTEDFFYQGIKEQTYFSYTKLTTKKISNILKSYASDKNIIIIEQYKSFWPWSKAVAYFSAKYPDMIFLNSRRIGKMPPASVVGTIVHEFVHLVDYSYKNGDFGHGNNRYSSDKGQSAPYWIGGFAKRIAKEKCEN